jgi:hypothetical protein
MTGSWLKDIDRRTFLRAAIAAAAASGLAGCSSSDDDDSSTTAPRDSARRFVDDFNRADGPVGNGWIDAHDVTPSWQDRVAIASHALTLSSLQGARDQDPASSGWRGAIYRETNIRDGVSVITRYGPAPFDATGGPLVQCNPTAKEFGIGCWYDHALRGWELGLIGLTQPDFQYLDFTFTKPPSGSIDLELRSTGDAVAFYVNGALRGGPVPVPASLRDSSLHGAQLDFLTHIPGTPTIDDCRIQPWRGRLASYTEASLAAGRVSTAGLNRPLQLSVPVGDADDALVAVIVSTSPSGWRARGWRRDASAAVPGTVAITTLSSVATSAGAHTVTFQPVSDSGTAAGLVLRLHDHNSAIPVLSDALATPQPSTRVPAPAPLLVGLHRVSIWLGATVRGATVSPPVDYEQIAAVPQDADAPALTVATRAWDGTPEGTPPFGDAADVPQQIGSSSVAAPSVGALVTVNPALPDQ